MLMPHLLHKMKQKLPAYSIVELLVTIAIFGLLSAMLGQTLLTNLTLSAKVSARTRMRSAIDQTMSLIERDFRNADYLYTATSGGVTYVSCGNLAAAQYYPGLCSSSCTMSTNSKVVTWCYRLGKIYRYEGGNAPVNITNESDPFLENVTQFSFYLNNTSLNSDKFNAYANVLVTLQADNNSMKVLNQVKQISVSTRNYAIK
jgi:type II secretory pathway pseudopilin PulG